MNLKLFIPLFFGCLLCGVVTKSLAQNFSIEGEVRDSISGFTLSGVTVAIYAAADSSLLDVQLTDNTGKFLLHCNPASGSVNLLASFAGHQTVRRFIQTDSVKTVTNTGVIYLQRNYKSLDEVIINPPVSMNGDTLEIHPEAFRLGPDAVVEDLLREVKGIVVWGDGTITVNGKKVDNVLVDGKPFIVASSRVATQNLPTEMIEKVQVYRKSDEYKFEMDSKPSDSLLTMNIRLKEGRKSGSLGKVEAAAGTSKKYELNISDILFTELSRLALVVGINNINKKISGVAPALENSTYKNPNPNLTNAPDFEMNGVNKTSFYGLAFQHEFRPVKRSFLKNDLSIETLRRDDNNRMSSESLWETMVNEVGQQMKSVSNSTTHSTGTGVKLSYQKRIKQKQFQIGTELNFQKNQTAGNSEDEVSEAGNIKSRKKVMDDNDNSENAMKVFGSFDNMDTRNFDLKSYHIDFSFSRKNQKNDMTTVNDFLSFSPDVPDNKINRFYDLSNLIHEVNANLSYPGLKRLIFGKRNPAGWSFRLEHLYNLAREDQKNKVADYDDGLLHYLANTALTYTDNHLQIQNKPGLRISKILERELQGRFSRSFEVEFNFRENFLMDDNSSDKAGRNLNRSFSFFEPEAKMTYAYGNNAYDLRLTYRHYISHNIPDINSLSPVIDDINPYSIHFGNPALKTEQTFNNELFFSYNRNTRSDKNIFSSTVRVGYKAARNAFSDSALYDDAGRMMIYPVNVSLRKDWSVKTEARYATRLNKHRLQAQFLSDCFIVTVPAFINSKYNLSNYLFLNHTIQFTYSVSSLLTLELSQKFNFNRSRLSKAESSNRTNNLFVTGARANLNFSPRVIFSNSLDYVDNTGQNKQFILWNAYLTFRLLKREQLEMKLSAFDILRRYQNIKTEIGYNYTGTVIHSGLQQFFMAGVSYYPRFY